MHPILQSNLFFVKEQVGLFKAANNFDIHDPHTQQKILECREPHLGLWTKLFRFTDYKRMTPFHMEVRTPDGAPVLTIKRGISLLLSTVEVLDEHGTLVGCFKQKFLSIGGKFDVLDARENVVCTLSGKWTGWDFRFVRESTELAHVAKKWAGLGKEMFTSADNYMLEVDPVVAPQDNTRLLILAAVLCIDMVLKE